MNFGGGATKFSKYLIVRFLTSLFTEVDEFDCKKAILVDLNTV